MADRPVVSDPWAPLRNATTARIGLARAGDALATAPMLDFQLAHARARDAVHAALDPSAIASALAPLATIEVQSQAADRSIYLRRPDLGRVLDRACADRLPVGPYDVVFVVGDGLSALAAKQHAPPVLRATLDRLTDVSLGPVVIARQARVALADDIGARMNASLTVILLGERPGLTTPDSLGIYVTYGPRRGRQDSERNCISNVHAHGGLSHAEAAEMLVRIVRAARGRQLTGVGLKIEGVSASKRLAL